MGRDERLKHEALGTGGLLHLLDRYGRPVTEGCEVAITSPQVGGIIIQSITPAVEPGAPPGALKVRALLPYEFYVQKGRPMTDVVRIATRDELIAAGRIREAPAEAEDPAADVAPEGEGIAPPKPGPKVEPLIQLVKD